MVLTLGSTSGISTITVTVNPFACPVGQAIQLKATGNWNTGMTTDETLSATWSSSATSVATVQTAGQTSPGLVSGVFPGSCTITAFENVNIPGRAWDFSNPACPEGDRSGSSPGNVLSVRQSPSSPPAVNMSTGDTKQITVTVNGTSGLSVSRSFVGKTTTNNPDSFCTATLTIPGASGTIGTGGSVSLTSNVTASMAGCSGIFSAVEASA